MCLFTIPSPSPPPSVPTQSREVFKNRNHREHQRRKEDVAFHLLHGAAPLGFWRLWLRQDAGVGVGREQQDRRLSHGNREPVLMKGVPKPTPQSQQVLREGVCACALSPCGPSFDSVLLSSSCVDPQDGPPDPAVMVGKCTSLPTASQYSVT